MEYRIDTIPEKKLLGKRMTMSISNNKTGELWRSFMVQRKEIEKNIGSTLYSMQLLPPAYFLDFNPNTIFEKWAVTEVSDFGHIPEGMETFILPAGLYAVFLYKGPASKGAEAFTYIFGTWLPASEYVLDDRPHFELLGEKYKNEDPESEEEIWVPIKPKQS